MLRLMRLMPTFVTFPKILWSFRQMIQEVDKYLYLFSTLKFSSLEKELPIWDNVGAYLASELSWLKTDAMNINTYKQNNLIKKINTLIFWFLSICNLIFLIQCTVFEWFEMLAESLSSVFLIINTGSICLNQRVTSPWNFNIVNMKILILLNVLVLLCDKYIKN